MFNHIKEKLSAGWNEVGDDWDKIIDWFTTNKKEIIMSLFSRLEASEAKIVALETAATPVDTSAFAKEADLAALTTEVTALKDAVGTPTVA